MSQTQKWSQTQNNAKLNQKNRGITHFTTHPFCVQSRKRRKTQTQKWSQTQNNAKLNQKNRGITRFTTHPFCVQSRKRRKTQTQKWSQTQNSTQRTVESSTLQRIHFAYGHTLCNRAIQFSFRGMFECFKTVCRSTLRIATEPR